MPNQNLNRWIRNFKRFYNSDRHVICFPHAGGAASYFHSWLSYLPSDISFSAIQYPGREDRLRDDLISNMQELCRQATMAVLPFCGENTILFGHSMGAVVAYEVALNIRSIGVPLARLIVSAHPPPHKPLIKKPPFTEDEILSELRIVSDEKLISFDLDTFREIFLPSLRSDYLMNYSYVREKATLIDIPVFALSGRLDPKVTPLQMDSWIEVAPKNAFKTKQFDGGHFYLNDYLEDVISVVTE